MESLSRPVRSLKIPLTVAIPDYLRDHCYDGRIVLPAAEALQILARSLPPDLPACDPRHQEGAAFAHLLPLDADADTFSAFHEIAFLPDGPRLSRLTTLRTGRQAQWTRSIEHVSVSFLPYPHELLVCAATFENRIPEARIGDFSAPPAHAAKRPLRKMRDSALFFVENRALSPFSVERSEEVQGRKMSSAQRDRDFRRSRVESEGKEGTSFRFSCRHLYADLVPFGPAYHNVVGEVSLTPDGASAEVSGGDCREAVGPLGSPFPFDAAMHLACAWGQRYRNLVAFPVGFDCREIVRPTRNGETYHCQVFPLPDEGAVLRFDVWLHGEDCRPVEIILGLKMRDISGGSLKPPAWVRKGV
jgi:hypothetical protein